MKRFLVFISLLGILNAFGQNISKIDTTEVIAIGGIKQCVKINGENRSNPILLYLHGGPGESVMDTAQVFTSKLQKYFTVVQWDQRETGRTLKLNHSPQKLSVRLMQKDAYEVVVLLLKKFKQKKLYLVGHSWGNVLGFSVAKEHPELLYAYLAISPQIKNSDHIWFDKVVAFEKQKNNQKALDELAPIKIPFQNFDQMFTARKWLSDYEGDPVPDEMVPKYLKMLEPWKNTWFTVAQEVNQMDLFKSVKSLQCPVYFFLGRTDNVTPTIISEAYFKQLKAPKKQLFWMEKSGHMVPMSEPDLLQEIIIEIVKG